MTTASPPGPPFPRSLQRLAFRVASTPFTEACSRRYGDVVLFDTRPAVVVISDPRLTKQVLHASGRELAFIGDVVLALLGEHSFIMLDEEHHLQWRRRISPLLRGEPLRSYAGLMRDRTDDAIGSWPVREPFALLRPLRRLTLEIVADLTLGPDDGPKREELLRAVGELARGNAPPARRNAPRAHIEELLAVEGRAMDLGDQALTLLVASSETTATTLAWAFELLLRHPAALESLRDDRYLAAVIEETLRLHPPVPHARRRVRDAPYALGGFVLAPGTEIRASLGRATDPAFRPERFLEGHEDASLPFGAGPHRCLGASFAPFEMGIILRRVFERLRLRLADRRPEKAALDGFTTAPARGVRVIAEPRC
jgi:cytochrome P450 family 135